MDKNLLMNFYTPQHSTTIARFIPELFFRGNNLVFKENEIVFEKKITNDTFINLIPLSRIKNIQQYKKLF
jgi:hypothetical protein